MKGTMDVMIAVERMPVASGVGGAVDFGEAENMSYDGDVRSNRMKRVNASPSRYMKPVFTSEVALMTAKEAKYKDLVKEIATTREALIKVVEVYAAGVNMGASKVSSTLRVSATAENQMKRIHEKLVKECEDYKQELLNHTIEGISSVVDKGITYTRNEPVRRTTETHLHVVQRDKLFDSELLNKYVELLNQFIEIVRWNF